MEGDAPSVVVNAGCKLEVGEGGRARPGLLDPSGLMVIGFQSDQRLSCAGYGDNAGLSAVLTGGSDAAGNPTFEGLIFPGDMPPLPDTSPAQ